MTTEPSTAESPSSTPPNEIEQITGVLRSFAAERDWEQFHTPKNLIMALTGEVGELAELFQWLAPEQVASAVQKSDFLDKVRDGQGHSNRK